MTILAEFGQIIERNSMNNNLLAFTLRKIIYAFSKKFLLNIER